MRQLKHCFFGLLCLIVCPLHAQVNTDSLKVVWNNQELSDSIRLAAINKLAWDGFVFTFPDSAVHYAQLQYQFAQEKGMKKEMAVARNTQGTALYLTGNYARAIAYFYQSLTIKESLNDYKGIAATLNNMGMIYDEQGNHTKAAQHYLRAINTFNKLPDQQKADRQVLVASYHNLGALYSASDSYDSALLYFNQALALTKDSEFLRERAYTYSNLGHIELDRNKPEKAYQHFTEAYTILDRIGDEIGMIDALNNLSFLYIRQSDYAKAVAYARRALVRAQQNRATSQIRYAAENLYTSYKHLGRYEQALTMHEVFVSARDSIRSEQNREEVIRQEFKYAYDKQAVADSIAYAAQQEIQHLKIAEQKSQLKSESTQRQLLYGMLALTLMLSFVGYRSYRRKMAANAIITRQKQQVEDQRDKIAEQHKLLEEKSSKIMEFNTKLESLVELRTQELENSLRQIRNYQFNLAHRVRAPFVTLLGLLNLIQDERFDASHNKEILHSLQETSKEMRVVLKEISDELNKYDIEPVDKP